MAKPAAAAACLLLAAAAAAAAPAPRTEKDLLETRVPLLSLKPGADVFWELCKAVQRPCGEEALRLDDPELAAPARGLVLADKTVKDVLEYISETAPSYQWRVRDGVIDLEPAAQGDSALDRKLEPITLRRVSAEHAAFLVLNRGGLSPSWGSRERLRVKPLDLELKGTLRDALNRIALSDGQAMWYFTVNAASRPFFAVRTWGPEPKAAAAERAAELKRAKEDYDRFNR